MAFLRQSADKTTEYFGVKDQFNGPYNCRSWFYYTTDDAPAVDASNYFADAFVVDNVRVGDEIYVYQLVDLANIAAGIVSVSKHVVVENTGTVIDLSDDIYGGGAGVTLTYGD